jgi:hypothetical protein
MSVLRRRRKPTHPLVGATVASAIYEKGQLVAVRLSNGTTLAVRKES